MKKYLAVFDLDNTIIDRDTKNHHVFEALYSDGKLPDNFFELRKYVDTFRQHVIDQLNERQLKKDQVLSILNYISDTVDSVVKGMDQVLKVLSEDHDIIVISDSNTFHAQHLLKHFGLDQYVSAVYSQPMTLTESGQFLCSDLKATWKAPCQYGGRNVCKGQVLLDYAGDKYQKILYIGDGSNDFCSAMNLSANDLVMPRKGFTLDKMLQSNNCQAEVKTWTDGYEIISFLQKLYR